MPNVQLKSSAVRRTSADGGVSPYLTDELRVGDRTEERHLRPPARLVRRPFPKVSFSEFDPFLLLDGMGPIELPPGTSGNPSGN